MSMPSHIFKQILAVLMIGGFIVINQHAVSADKSLPTAAATDLKFRDFFKSPVGPRGLEPTTKLLSLAGQRVRIVGYMVQQETPMPGVVALTPLPVSIGDEDESLADDLPPSTVYVHITDNAKIISYRAGLIQLLGKLELGSYEESDGHVSNIRLQLGPKSTALLLNESLPKNTHVSLNPTTTSTKEH